MRTAYLDTLYDLASKDKKVFALISDNGAIVYDKYRKDLAAQYLNLGISEANMLGVAAGMASCGKIPFAYTIGAFLAYRAFEFIRNDICLQKQNVKIVGTGAGMVYSALGPTHHSTEDLGCIRSFPNLTILSPASPMEVKKATAAAYEHDGPVYLRLGTNKEPEIYRNDYEFHIGKAVTIKEGNDLTLIGTGSILKDLLEIAEELESKGIHIRVVNMHTIKPLDEETVNVASDNHRLVITVEEHSILGGLGSAVSEVLVKKEKHAPLDIIGIEDLFVKPGDYQYQIEQSGLTGEQIAERVSTMYRYIKE